MKRTNLYLDEAQTVALDEMASAQGISRAELVRRLLDRGLNGTPIDEESDLSAIEESFGVMDNRMFSARGPDERAAHLDRLRAS